MIKKISKIIDHTNIERGAKAKDIIRTCEEAIKYGFRGVCVRPKWVRLAKRILGNSGVKVICLVDPPIGDSSPKERLRISKKAKADGADELDVVVSIPDVKHERWKKIERDLKRICNILPTKIIIGSGYLTDQEIEMVSKIAKRAGAFCIKTSTEKDPLDHRELKEKVLHLKLIKKSAPGIMIKASGKIHSANDVIMMMRAGADIIGTSFGVQICEELKTKI